LERNYSNLFHAALIKVHDVAKNGTRNTAAWNEVLEVVDRALEQARRLDARDAAERAADERS
jgi:hypothetical protein